MVKLEPFDVIVFDGLWYMPHHWLIRWRGLDRGVHCCTVSTMNTPEGYALISPEFTGMRGRELSHYKGRRITVHRYNGGSTKTTTLKLWLQETLQSSKGYDFRQWFMGFILGITTRKQVDNSDHWTCAELPYWLFQENAYLTPRDEILPMPRFFRYSPKFDVIFDGVL